MITGERSTAHAALDAFNALPAHVWPRGARREEDGEVTIAGVPLTEIAEDYGTPVMVVDEDDFRSRCRDMADAFGSPANVHYASKAFLTRRVACWVDEEGLALDVASENELRRVSAAPNHRARQQQIRDLSSTLPRGWGSARCGRLSPRVGRA